jgi:peptidoglycan hydrolase CwlO-like protein
MPPKLSNEIIEAAIAGFQGQKKHIDEQVAELRAMLSGRSSKPTTATDEAEKGPRRKISTAGRKRMAAAQKKRWAAVKGETTAPAKKTSKPKRKLSAAGRAAIVAAMKKRWADKKTAKK